MADVALYVLSWFQAQDTAACFGYGDMTETFDEHDVVRDPLAVRFFWTQRIVYELIPE